MEQDYGANIISITDEDGVEYELEVLSSVTYRGAEYLALTPADADEDAEEQGESRQFMQWPEVVSEIRKTNMPLWGVLSDSTAYIRDDFVLVDCMYPTFSQLIRQGTNAADVKKAVVAVTGKKYRLGIFKHKENAAKQEESTDPLSNLMEKMRKADIKVDINE